MLNQIRTSALFSVMTSRRGMITLLRHDQNMLREEDGAVEIGRLKRDNNANFPHSVRWSNNAWINNLRRGGGGKKRFQFSTIRNKLVILYCRAIQGHSGETTVDPISMGQRVDSRTSLIRALLREEKFMDEIDRRCSLQPLIQWRTTGSIKKKNVMCPNPDTPGISVWESRTRCSFFSLTLLALSEWD